MFLGYAIVLILVFNMFEYYLGFVRNIEGLVLTNIIILLTYAMYRFLLRRIYEEN